MRVDRVGFWRVVIVSLILAGALAPRADAQRLLADGVKDLAEQIAAKAKEQQKLRVAVLPFQELDGRPTVLGIFLAEELFTHLVNSGLEIIERQMLDKVLGEIELGETGLIDADTAKKVGKVIGVDAVVTGSITDLQSYVAINCRLIDVSTGRIFGAAQTKVVKDDDVRKLMATVTPSPAPPAEHEAASDGGSTGQRNPPSERADSRMIRTEGGFRFELKACIVSGSSATCQLQVINQGEDRELVFYARGPASYPPVPGSRLFDSEGNEAEAAEVTLGSQGSRIRVTSLLVSGIPARGQARFDGVGSSASKAALVELLCYSGRAGFRVQFRDVPLVRR